MRGSADAAGMPDVGSRRAFFDCEIVRQISRSKWSFNLPPIFTFPKCSSSHPIFGIGWGAFFLWRFSPLLLWPRFLAPILTAEMECIL